MPADAAYEIIIGLEVHAQLLTQTKLFCSDSTVYGAAPNTQVSAISLGHPGTLPRLNREAIALAIRLGLATNCTIVQRNYFARKNYFYPDLPKGYQISQHTTPICRNGYLTITVEGKEKNIRINRIHMEEDAGKSLHDVDAENTGLDFNRAGMPLLEIVTEPDIRTSAEAVDYVSRLRKLVRHLQVCDGNMEEGSLRCDVNISVRPMGDEKLGTRVEIKNLNSIRFIKKAIEFESERLIGLHRNGIPFLQETRGFDEQTATTYSIRVKEDEEDYRYFPEPDLPPFIISDETIAAIQTAMPPLQSEIKRELVQHYQLPDYDSSQLSADMELYQLFITITRHTTNYKAIANWVLGPVKNYLAQQEISLEESQLLPASIAGMINLIDQGRITFNIAVQKIFPELVRNPLLNIEDLIKEKGWIVETSQDRMEELVLRALEKHAARIPEYKKGKKGLVSLFVGEVMKLSNGTADARLVTEMIIEKLKNS